MKLLKLFLLCFFIFSCIDLQAQIKDAKKLKSLEERIQENNALMMSKPEVAYHELENLLKIAQEQNNQEAELSILSRKAWYFIRKSEFEKALEAAQALDKKGLEYDDLYWQSYAHQYLLEIYSYNDLKEKAVEEFEKSIRLLEKSNRNEEDLNYGKATSYLKLGNIYLKNDNEKSKEALLTANKHVNKISNIEKKQRFLYFNYTNLGSVYLELDKIDSAEYYALGSLKLGSKEEERSLNQFRNYLLLGLINNKNNNYTQAISNFKKAEQLSDLVPVSLNDKYVLYKETANAYEKTGNMEMADFYNDKWKDNQLELEQNRVKALHKVIDDKLLEEKNYSTYIIIGSFLIFIVMAVLLLRFYRKNKILSQQEEISEEYLEEKKNEPTSGDYLHLIELAKKDDPAFLSNFYQIFPDFLEKLQKIHPKIVQTEVEFCAFLKLNLPTKEIARNKNIEPRTVQNKKYLIRKKLNIPKEIDIYHWFNEF